MTTGAELISAERQRQIDSDGWTTEIDDQWVNGELAQAAAFYANPVDISAWPWPNAPKLGARVRELQKAGALCAAEIDRLTRLEGLFV